MLCERDISKRRGIAAGKSPFFELALDRLMSEGVRAGHLEFAVANLELAAASSNVFFVATGTPTLKDGSVDLSAVLDACRDVARGLKAAMSNAAVILGKKVNHEGDITEIETGSENHLHSHWTMT